jgi:hypothetical protein
MFGAGHHSTYLENKKRESLKPRTMVLLQMLPKHANSSLDKAIETDTKGRSIFKTAIMNKLK